MRSCIRFSCSKIEKRRGVTATREHGTINIESQLSVALERVKEGALSTGLSRGEETGNYRPPRPPRASITNIEYGIGARHTLSHCTGHRFTRLRGGSSSTLTPTVRPTSVHLPCFIDEYLSYSEKTFLVHYFFLWEIPNIAEGHDVKSFNTTPITASSRFKDT